MWFEGWLIILRNPAKTCARYAAETAILYKFALYIGFIKNCCWRIQNFIILVDNSWLAFLPVFFVTYFCLDQYNAIPKTNQLGLKDFLWNHIFTPSIGLGAEQSEYPQVLMHSVKLSKRKNLVIKVFDSSCLFVNVFFRTFLAQLGLSTPALRCGRLPL